MLSKLYIRTRIFFWIHSISISCSLLCDNILGNNFVSFFRVLLSCNNFGYTTFSSSIFSLSLNFLSLSVTLFFSLTAYLWTFSFLFSPFHSTHSLSLSIYLLLYFFPYCVSMDVFVLVFY